MTNKRKAGSGMAIGLIFGAAIGIAMNNLGLCLALGVVFGAGIEQRMKSRGAED